jgi:hypothetical protein
MHVTGTVESYISLFKKQYERKTSSKTREEAKQPSPCELGCLLIVVSALD